MAEVIVKLLCRPGSPINSSFCTPIACTQFQGEPLQRGHKIQGGGKILRFSTEIAVYPEIVAQNFTTWQIVQVPDWPMVATER